MNKSTEKKEAIIQFRVSEEEYWELQKMKGLKNTWYDFFIKPILEKEKQK